MAVLAAGLCAAALAVGCTRVVDGAAQAPESPQAAASTSAPAGPTGAPPTMGVVSTLPDTVPPNALVCLQLPRNGGGVSIAAVVGDPAAPRIVLSAPSGWAATPDPRDATAIALTGPDGLTGRITIARTDLPPAEAFERYSNQQLARAPIGSVSLLPADFCGYSGQRIIGSWSGGPDGDVVYEDRVNHIWTNTGSYLVAIHVQAPKGAPGFDAAKEQLLQDYSITIP